jgi:hypothetical protein
MICSGFLNVVGGCAGRQRRQTRKVQRHRDRKLRRPGLGHPRRQQRARAVGLLDDKVNVALMVQPAHHHNAFARTRMLGVLDQNVKGLFLGGVSPSRTTS